jgi:hypothetical protein
MFTHEPVVKQKKGWQKKIPLKKRMCAISSMLSRKRHPELKAYYDITVYGYHQ